MVKYASVNGQRIIVCETCGRHALQTRISYFCVDLHTGNQIKCDECRTTGASK